MVLASQVAASFASGYGGQTPRVPMTFTSRLRLIAAGGSGDVVAFFERATLATQISQFSLSGPTFRPVIEMLLNPNSVRFAQPKRITKKDTRDGSVFFHFSNSKGQNNDILTIAFAGSTGNIDPRGSLPAQAEADTGARERLIVWHNLYQLTREPMLLADGSLNLAQITYQTKLMPVPVTFFGHFSRVLEFEESAQKPNSVAYSFEFTVTNTSPSLDKLAETLTVAFGGGPTETLNIAAGDADSVTVAEGATLPSGTGSVEEG